MEKEKPFDLTNIPFGLLREYSGYIGFPTINKKSAFYKNCKRQRKLEAKICQDCPFRKGIEAQE